MKFVITVSLFFLLSCSKKSLNSQEDLMAFEEVLHLAFQEDNFEYIQVIYSEKDVNETVNDKGQNVLHLATKYFAYDLLPFLLEERKAQVNSLDFNHNTAIHILVEEVGSLDSQTQLEKKDDYMKIAEYLLKSGANVSILDKDGEFPFNKTEHTELKDLLLKYY